MVREQLTEKILRLYRHFRRNMPPPDTMDLWFDQLGHVPADAGEWIVIRIINQFDRLPENIVKVFKELWQAYQQENPEKIAKKHESFCRICGGRGLIWITKIEDGYLHNYVCRCGHCQNHERIKIPDNLPRWTVEQIRGRGFEFCWRNESPAKEDRYAMIEKKVNPEPMAKKIGRPMKDEKKRPVQNHSGTSREPAH